MKLTPLYEDNHLLVVQKPVNMPTQADSSGDMDLLSLCKQYVKEKYNKPGAVYLGLVHRLDRPVGGVLLFARTSKAAARMSKQIAGGQMLRRYLAVVQGEPPEQGILRHHLLKDEHTNNTAVVREGTPGAKLASLEYEGLAVQGGLSLLSIRLHTGRSHQIRVQFAAEGHPLWGDQRYGENRPGRQIALFAAELICQHPITGNELRFALDMPEGTPWDAFRQGERV